ncbi:MAG: PQQ-dependent sugar dehydrogenase [Alphaproteobacteria bacterium]|nr:PQQ-dependent sugar dehydrogenase [Alphaproteobacteria bacterium]
MKSHVILLILVFMGISSFAQQNKKILVPKNFLIEIIADNIGSARHLTVAPNGDIYVKLNDLKDGKGIVKLQKNGATYTQYYFGNYEGTGICIQGNYLYASSNEAVYKYQFDKQWNIMNPNHPDTIIEKLVSEGQHESKSLVVNNQNEVYVNIGAYSNACQEQDRTPQSKGFFPCPILEKAGGIWKFSSQALHQSYPEGDRWATGLRNVVGLDWNYQTNSLFVTQHGMDQLADNYPQYYSKIKSANTPAECLYDTKLGTNAGWPYSYYDYELKKIMLAPAYGGDGIKEYQGVAQEPVMAFPAHLAPNGLLFYTGNLFPEKYKNGAFIAFHGSWNRSPEPQAGFFVVFVPFKDSKPTLKDSWEIFADGFAEVKNPKSPNLAKHRPCGLAQDIEGNLYISDDKMGTIYKVSYRHP